LGGFWHYWLFDGKLEARGSNIREDDLLRVVRLHLALSWAQQTFPFHTVIHNHLYLLYTLSAIQDAFIVIPKFDTSNCDLLIEDDLNLERAWWGGQVAEPHLLFIVGQSVPVDQLLYGHFWTLALVANKDAR